jgi:hypothetical protein
VGRRGRLRPRRQLAPAANLGIAFPNREIAPSTHITLGSVDVAEDLEAG